MFQNTTTSFQPEAASTSQQNNNFEQQQPEETRTALDTYHQPQSTYFQPAQSYVDTAKQNNDSQQFNINAQPSGVVEQQQQQQQQQQQFTAQFEQITLNNNASNGSNNLGQSENNYQDDYHQSRNQPADDIEMQDNNSNNATGVNEPKPGEGDNESTFMENSNEASNSKLAADEPPTSFNSPQKPIPVVQQIATVVNTNNTNQQQSEKINPSNFATKNTTPDRSNIPSIIIAENPTVQTPTPQNQANSNNNNMHLQPSYQACKVPDFSAYCRQRFSELSKSNPNLIKDRLQVSQMLAQEWKQIQVARQSASGQTSTLLKSENNEENSNSPQQQLSSSTPPTAAATPSTQQNNYNNNFQHNSQTKNMNNLNNMNNTQQVVVQQPQEGSRKWSVFDGRPPKRPLTSYMIFVKERKPILMMQNPSTSFKDMMGIVAEVWRNLDAPDREYFDRAAEQDRLRHEKEKLIWIEHLKRNPQINSTQWHGQPKKASHSPYLMNTARNQVIVPQSYQKIKPVVKPQPAMPQAYQLNQQAVAQNQQQQQKYQASLQALINATNSNNSIASQNVNSQSIANNNIQFFQTMVEQQQSYIQTLLEQKKVLVVENEKLKHQNAKLLQQSSQKIKNENLQDAGYQMFMKSLTQEIKKRNPVNQFDVKDMARIVNQEWEKLNAEQKQIYTDLARQTQSTAASTSIVQKNVFGVASNGSNSCGSTGGVVVQKIEDLTGATPPQKTEDEELQVVDVDHSGEISNNNPNNINNNNMDKICNSIEVVDEEMVQDDTPSAPAIEDHNMVNHTKEQEHDDGIQAGDALEQEINIRSNSNTQKSHSNTQKSMTNNGIEMQDPVQQPQQDFANINCSQKGSVGHVSNQEQQNGASVNSNKQNLNDELMVKSVTGSQRQASLIGSQKQASVTGSQKQASIIGSQKQASVSESQKQERLSGSAGAVKADIDNKEEEHLIDKPIDEGNIEIDNKNQLDLEMVQ